MTAIRNHPTPERSRPSPKRSRPDAARAAAAARLAGAPAEEKDVTARLATAEHRAKTASASRLSTAPSRLRAAIGGHGPAAPSPAVNPEHEERPRHLRVVEKKPRSPAQRQRRARLIIVGAIFAAAMVGLVLVYFHVILAQRQFALDKLQTTLQKQQITYQEQRLQVAELNSPQRIISEAEGKLGMVQPTSVTYLSQPSTTKASAAQSNSGASSTLDEPTTGNLVQPASQAPAGDADWPSIKASLQGAP